MAKKPAAAPAPAAAVNAYNPDAILARLKEKLAQGPSKAKTKAEILERDFGQMLDQLKAAGFGNSEIVETINGTANGGFEVSDASVRAYFAKKAISAPTKAAASTGSPAPAPAPVKK